MSFKYSDKYKNIGTKISKYRIKNGLTQEQLANKVGISYSYLTQIEAPNVIKKMSLEVLFDIADVLNIDIKDLL
ncbi:MAG: helix-turn-helix transcriptional regulator [Clostridia bacterium]|jgi:transcriptional regulator with XRE-family HTH domain|nr:helix-turn-helix transcriptional regulator [Clostridia bacterium]